MQLELRYDNLSSFGVQELKLFEDKIRIYFIDKLETSSIFLVPVDLNNSNSFNLYELICKEIGDKLHFVSERISLDEMKSENIFLQQFLFENISPDKVKKLLSNSLSEITRNESRNKININKFGLFLPRTGKVTCYSFAHGEGHYYRYRLAQFKLHKIFPPLKHFLLSLPSSCPNQYFLNGSRASNFDLEIKVKLNQVDKHSVINFATQALNERILKSAHEDIEKFFLESDPETIACEVPIWFETSELNSFEYLNSKIIGTLTGHIDVLRYERNNKIGIWDYKPDAHSETMAHIQVYLYALMLSKRINYPLDKFICGYFNSKNAFYFNANEVIFI